TIHDSRLTIMKTLSTLTSVSHLECSSCGKWYDAYKLQTFAGCCNKPLLVKYSPEVFFQKEMLKDRPWNMWRYHEMLPVLEKENIVSLGEGMTPMMRLDNIGNKYEYLNLLMKDEGKNPTGSFKARGLSAAISKAKENGIETCIIPTAGNAGGAMAAYCAAAGMRAIVVMPRHTPKMFMDECEVFGAKLILVDGLISDCAKKVASLKHEIEAFDISTLKEPYRIEGKKTMGYEIAEQLNWELPDVILYPTGGGTGLIGMWKAFQEMISLGWIRKKLPRMIAVQAENCQPIMKTWIGEQSNCKAYIGKPSVANGLAVPNPFGEDLILQVLRESNGFPIAISDVEMIASIRELADKEGIFVAPEGGALLAALKQLTKEERVNRAEKILLLNTGSGYKYMENLQ
ncbi:MAG TPA: threonine synthase, partial [Chitinophagaceae bacterium]|nr:threonine synthase [Chitinophagaceae bacterium]